MRLKLKKFEVAAGRPIVFLNQNDAHANDISVGDRVLVAHGGNKIIARVDIVRDFLEAGEFSLSEDAKQFLKIITRDVAHVTVVAGPRSAVYIAKKMNGKVLSKPEIQAIIEDIVSNALTEAEIAQFVVGVYRNGMNHRETVDLTDVMCKTGQVLKWHSKLIADKHCIGGIAGNRTTPIVVSMCAAAGVVMPKTSSRAITSAAGTADVIETLAHVDFPASELQRIVKKTGACLAWGGSLGLAPADDKLIRIERILKIDPDAQLLASILSKKLSVGSTHVLIDIPCGEGAKISRQRAADLRARFLSLGKSFGLKMEVLLTEGAQPVGNGVGPILEMIDVLKVLRREHDAPKDLEQKAIMLAGEVFELVGKAKKGQGVVLAREMLESKQAYAKFEEILNAQGRHREALRPGKIQKVILAARSGIIRHIDNKGINGIASVLGCPTDKGAGIFLFHHAGDKVTKGMPLMRFYTEAHEKMQEALVMYQRNEAIVIR